MGGSGWGRGAEDVGDERRLTELSWDFAVWSAEETLVVSHNDPREQHR